MTRFPTIPCENEYKRLAEADPDLLVEWVESGELNQPSDLTFAAEYLGKCPGSLPVLLRLLKHDSSLVREGSIYGLQGLKKMIGDALEEVSKTDSSTTIRGIASECLDRP